MAIERQRRWFAASLLAALVLAACGGGDPYVPGSDGPSGAPTTKGTFSAVVSFGTSASDLGTYAPATPIPGTNPPQYFGGKFSTNSPTATVWVQNVATALGLLVTPAAVGFQDPDTKEYTSVACPVALAQPALAGTCTGYAQGGAMITTPEGIGHAAGALTVPLATQIDNHLARFGSFKDSDLIFVEGGLNDLFLAFGTFAAQAGAIAAEVQAGTIPADEGNRLLFEKQTEAQAKLRRAALELAGYVRTKILANGGKYVAVATMPDTSSTPFGRAVGAQSTALQAAIHELTAVFNLWLREGLKNQPVAILDVTEFFNAVVADPAAFGIANATDQACDDNEIRMLAGLTPDKDAPVFVCNSTPGVPPPPNGYNTLVDGASDATWFFADDVHPTTGGHRLLGERALEQLRALGWI